MIKFYEMNCVQCSERGWRALEGIFTTGQKGRNYGQIEHQPSSLWLSMEGMLGNIFGISKLMFRFNNSGDECYVVDL